MNKPKSQYQLECERKGKLKICPECRKEFICEHWNQKYCSKACQIKKYVEMARLRKECAIYGMSELEKERLREKAKRDSLTILD
jgi:NAD-dependent SIR2 family protein deacetylase